MEKIDKLNKINRFLDFVMWVIIALTLIGVGILIGVHIGKNDEKKESEECHAYIEEEFVMDNIRNLILDMGFPFPEVVYAQTVLETGNFSSDVFIENNNLFGMKMPRQRMTFAIGIENGYALYQSWHYSLYDYVIWYTKYCSGFKTQTELLDYLGRVYATDKQYVAKLKRIIKLEGPLY